jgi:hypothetical protein
MREHRRLRVEADLHESTRDGLSGREAAQDGELGNAYLLPIKAWQKSPQQSAFARGADNLLQIFHARQSHVFVKAGDDFACEARPFVNQAGVNLEQRRARRDFFPRIVRAENSTDADDGQSAICPPMNVPDDFRAARAQRFSAQATGFGIDLLQGRGA